MSGRRRVSFRHLRIPRRALWNIGLAAACLVFTGARDQNAPQSAPIVQGAQQYLNAKPGVEYLGDEACRSCHASIYTRFKRTGMGRSVSLPSDEDMRALEKPVTIAVQKLNRFYSIYARNGKIIHEESEHDSSGRTIFTEAHEIAYAVGAGDVGKSYLIAKGDSFFVSPISYYTRIGGWDLSPGYAQGAFRGFTRRVVDLCVDCHTGMPQLIEGSTTRFRQPPFRFLTVGCERCHGPGAAHVRLHNQEATSDAAAEQGPIDLSIVNPGKLHKDIRDDVCAQCHLAGDARVLQTGKSYLDFRPGTPLADVVAIFSVPQTIKGNHFVALDQFEQMKTSRCWNASDGHLGCISCHDPHVQPRADEAAGVFRERCLTCHATKTCSAPKIQRQTTSPPDNCIACHMPKQPTENIGHSSITDHRILRTQSEILAPRGGTTSQADLIAATTVSGQITATTNLRNLALAYAQIAGRYQELGEKGLATLERAATALPNDSEIQAAYGQALSVARPREEEHAAEVFQKSIDLGSQSAEVRTHLARLRMRQGRVTAAMDLYKESIRIDSYFTPAYLDLAMIDARLKDWKAASEILDRLLEVDPGNDAARKQRQELVSAASKDK